MSTSQQDQTLVRMQYLGSNSGQITVQGQESNKKYRVSRTSPYFDADPRDVAGLLERRKPGGDPLYQLVERPAPQDQQAPPELEPTVTGATIKQEADDADDAGDADEDVPESDAKAAKAAKQKKAS
jgi:hypothetical protein